MSFTVDITLDDLYKAVGNFLQGVVGVDPNTSALVPVVTGQPNLVPQPAVPYMLIQGFVSGRHTTNIHRYDTAAQTTATQQNTTVKMQLDCYGPASHTWATMVSTLWRDPYGCAVLKPSGCQPLYTGEPFQGALVNGEEQYEERWTVELFLQYNPVTIIPQQSATAAGVTVINVDEKYAP